MVIFGIGSLCGNDDVDDDYKAVCDNQNQIT